MFDTKVRPIKERLEKWNIELKTICSKNKFHKNPPWDTIPLKLDKSLSSQTKTTTSSTVCNKMFNQKISLYKNYTPYYTDGSVIGNKTGCAIFSNNMEIKIKLPNNTSIFTAEMHDILKTIKLSRNTNNRNILICCDSLSCLKSLQQMYNKMYL